MEYDETGGVAAGGQLNYTAEELRRLYPNSFPPTQPNAYYQAGYAPAEEVYQGVQGAWPDDQVSPSSIACFASSIASDHSVPSQFQARRSVRCHLKE